MQFHRTIQPPSVTVDVGKNIKSVRAEEAARRNGIVLGTAPVAWAPGG